jgi:hypothetical protein
MKTIFNLILLLISLSSCNSKIEKNAVDPIYDSKGNQLLTNEWIMSTQDIIAAKLEIKLNYSQLSDTSSEVLALIYSNDSSLTLMNSPFRLEKDTLLIDTIENRIIDHHSFYLSKDDTTRIKFKTSNVEVKEFNKVGLLYKRDGVFYFMDTTFTYSRNF